MSRTRVGIFALAVLPGLLVAQERPLAPGAAAPGPRRESAAALQLSLWSTIVPTLAGAALWLPALAPNWSEGGGGTGGPVAGAALTAGGLLIGPSLGYFYGGAAGRGWRGLGIRAAIGGIMTRSFTADAPDWVPFAGGAAVVASAIWDIASVKRTVTARNASRPRLTLAPFSGNLRAPGLYARIEF